MVPWPLGYGPSATSGVVDLCDEMIRVSTIPLAPQPCTTNKHLLLTLFLRIPMGYKFPFLNLEYVTTCFPYSQLQLLSTFQILKIRDRPCTPTFMQSSPLPLPSSAWARWNGDFLQLLLCDPFLRRPLSFLDMDLSNLAMHPSLLLIVAESLPLLWRLTLCLGTLPLSPERISTWLWSVLAWVWPSILCFPAHSDILL